MNFFDRKKVQSQYVEATLADLSDDELTAVAYDFLYQDTDKLSDKELLNDVAIYYPSILRNHGDETENTD